VGVYTALDPGEEEVVVVDQQQQVHSAYTPVPERLDHKVKEAVGGIL